MKTTKMLTILVLVLVVGMLAVVEVTHAGGADIYGAILDNIYSDFCGGTGECIVIDSYLDGNGNTWVLLWASDLDITLWVDVRCGSTRTATNTLSALVPDGGRETEVIFIGKVGGNEDHALKLGLVIDTDLTRLEVNHGR